MINGWIGALILVSVSAAVVSFVSPDGEMKKYVELIARLCVLAAIVIPAVAAIKNIPVQIPEYEELAFDQYATGERDVISLTKANIESSVASRVEERFGLQKGSVTVEATLDASDTSAVDIIGIAVSVPPGTDADAVKSFVLKLFENTTDVVIKEASHE